MTKTIKNNKTKIKKVNKNNDKLIEVLWIKQQRMTMKLKFGDWLAKELLFGKAFEKETPEAYVVRWGFPFEEQRRQMQLSCQSTRKCS